MKICHVDPACGLDIPPKNWGAIEKIIWEFETYSLHLPITRSPCNVLR